MRERKPLGLLRRQRDGRGLADDDLLAVLLPDGLIDREHLHVAQNGVGDVFVGGARLIRLFVMRQQHVDVVVGQNEAAGRRVRRDVHRHGADPGRQHRGEVAAALADDDLVLANGLALRDRHAHDRADELRDGVGPIALFDEARVGRGGGPTLPADVAIADRLAGVEIGFRDQHVDGRERRRRRRRRLRLGRSTAAGEVRSYAAGAESDPEDDETRGFHYAYFPNATAQLAVIRDFTS